MVSVPPSDGVDRRQADALELFPDVGAGLRGPRVARQRAELLLDLLELGAGGGRLPQVPDLGGGEDLLALEQELVDPHPGRVRDPGDDPGALLWLLGGLVPEDG